MKKKWLYWKIVSDTYICKEDEFVLYDLKISIVQNNGSINNNQSEQQEIFWSRVDNYFEMIGENIYLPNGQPFSIYDISAVLPLLAAKQRVSSKNDWMENDNIIAVPDPHCTYQLRIQRIAIRCFTVSETSESIKSIK